MYKVLFYTTYLIIFSIQTIRSQTGELPNLFHTTPYTYFVGLVEPESGWNQVNFNDTAWLTGKGCIGYGDGDDTTVIGKTSSVYLRIPFILEDRNSLKMANLMVDFDDGFVAYLNGNEIARVNIGKWGEFVSHDRLTDRSHEAYFYRSYFSPF